MSKIEEILGYKFNDDSLLKQALMHKSFADQSPGALSNERMEFLGDSVLGLIVCTYLYGRFPYLMEDRLSKIKSTIVSQKNLAVWAESIALGKYIQLSDSESLAGGSSKPSILASGLESIVGAIFIDGGLDAAKNFLENFLDKTDMGEMEIDFKSELQELVQKEFAVLPVYKVLSEEGPSHSKIFEVAVIVRDDTLGIGRGLSKKDAQKFAASAALEKLRNKN